MDARILGELLMLGFDISERTISRWMKRAPRMGVMPAKHDLNLAINSLLGCAELAFRAEGF